MPRRTWRPEHIEEAAREHRAVLVLRIAFPLDVPILDGSNDVGLIGCSKLKLDFITVVCCQGLGEADRGDQLQTAGVGDPEGQHRAALGSMGPQRFYPRPTSRCIPGGFSARCVRVWYRQEKACTHLQPNYAAFRVGRASYRASTRSVLPASWQVEERQKRCPLRKSTITEVSRRGGNPRRLTGLQSRLTRAPPGRAEGFIFAEGEYQR